jgi:hypothetical protein
MTLRNFGIHPPRRPPRAVAGVRVGLGGIGLAVIALLILLGLLL